MFIVRKRLDENNAGSLQISSIKIKKIEKIQKRATKLPPYLKKVPYINRLDRFKLTTLETRRKREREKKERRKETKRKIGKKKN